MMSDVSPVVDYYCYYYKDLQKKTYPPLCLKILVYTPPTQIKQTLYTQLGVIYAQAIK
jgi:hypothetical protein